MNIGTVVEGETDYLLLEAIILELFPTARLLPIQPTEPGKGGWRDVQKWCQETWQRPGASLDQIISGQTGPKLDLLIIHVDADIARQSDSDLQKNVTSPITDVLQPCPPSVETVDKLKQVVARWLNFANLNELPKEVVLAIPSQDSENWLFAALFPDDDFCHQPDYECLHPSNSRKHPAYLLTLKKYGKVLRRKDGKIKKSKSRYKQVLSEVAKNWDKVCHICSQAQVFNDDLMAI